MLKGPPRSVLVYPPIEAVADALRIWTLDYVASFPLALLRLGRFLRDRGHDVTMLDALGGSVTEGRAPQEETDRLLAPDRIVRHARLGNFDHEDLTAPVYRVGLTKDALAPLASRATMMVWSRAPSVARRPRWRSRRSRRAARPARRRKPSRRPS